MNSTTNIIPFDSGKSYVVRDLEVNDNLPYRMTDQMGRTELDRRFLEQFEEIFLAASKGDVQKCQKVINEGFCDFKAYSVGRFGTKNGNYLNISPLQIAKDRGHELVVELFERTIANKKT